MPSLFSQKKKLDKKKRRSILKLRVLNVFCLQSKEITKDFLLTVSYSTVTDFARLRGLSTSYPRSSVAK
ncbi:hypothetical protein NRIC_23750 [Enterococcus florum]|uniref:Uncharacterized protein n=1 Tax=Enterococcus florum TaxID=2480627 RepID=A0A4P5PD43_9ENTE|nr:hypothetical protein NRIC_23750 [Enterococcus florum]